MMALRERRPRVGIYSIRCLDSGDRWIGRSTDLEAVKKRIFFTLAHRGNPHRSLQEAWDRFGSEAFSFEDVEVLTEEASDSSRDLWLKNKLTHWAAELQAKRI